MNSASNCCFFHKWGQWRMYEERSALLVKGKQEGPFVETRQIRYCEDCKFVQDRFIKSGPMAQLPEGKP